MRLAAAAGQRSRTSSTNGARFIRAIARPAAPVKSGGVVATTTSARPAMRRDRGRHRHEREVERAAASSASSPRSPSPRRAARGTGSSGRPRRTRPRYSGGITPCGWFGNSQMTVTSWPRSARYSANDCMRDCVAPTSGGKYCERRTTRERPGCAADASGGARACAAARRGRASVDGALRGSPASSSRYSASMSSTSRGTE